MFWGSEEGGMKVGRESKAQILLIIAFYEILPSIPYPVASHKNVLES